MAKPFLKKIIISSMLFATISFHDVSAHSTNFNMSYLYFGSPKNYINIVEQAKGSINTVSPNYFNLNANGSLQLSKNIDKNFIQAIHAKGVKVTPFLSNHWDREIGRAALKNANKLAADIANIIATYNLDGINIDIENVSEVDREQYTYFVKTLKNKLPKSKVVSVAVAANPNGWTKGWHGSYDYKNLSKYADYLLLMAYDESYSGSKEGPIASIDWVERGIKYALNQGVPNEKLVLGIPFYGRYWIEGESYGGYGIADAEIYQLVEKYNGKITVDRLTMSAKAVVTIKQGQSTKIGSKTYGPGTYHIWFENEETMKAKISLIHKYHLKGTGSWSLGQENKMIWNNYSKWLANHDLSNLSSNLEAGVFLDTYNHWAMNDIKSIYQKGWMQGKSDSKFGVNEALTRAQAAVIFARALDLKPVEPIQMSSFKDVSNNHWAKDQIELVKQHGIIYGSKSQFNPNAPLPRAQMAAILDRIINKNPDPIGELSSPFTDVSNNHWALESMVRLKKQGIFSGYSNGRFGPNDTITRAQMAVLLNRIAPIIDPSSSSDKENSNDQSSDHLIEYQVIKGDTLSSIAMKFGTSVLEIKQFNNLTSDLIYVGQILKIPSTIQPVPSETPDENATNPSEDQEQVRVQQYKVVTGDTLFKIAERFHVTVDEIKKINHLTSDIIYVGQILQIPVGEDADNPTNPVGNRDIVIKQLLEDTFNYVGVPYVTGGVTPDGFDCSGFVYYMYKTHGIEMERTTSQHLYTMGKAIDKQKLQPGDLVFFAIDTPNVISHVGFYLGDKKFISATTGKGIWVYSIDDSYWSKYYVGAKRIY